MKKIKQKFNKELNVTVFINIKKKSKLKNHILFK